MKIENNYENLKRTTEETSPLPKEPADIPVRAINPELYDYTEDKSQIELEIEIEKKGVPIIDVERPPIPDVHTDPTPYKKIAVHRKPKKSDSKEPAYPNDKSELEEDREMKAFVETLRILRKKSLWQRIIKKIYDLSCKIKKIAFNVVNENKRKKIKLPTHIHKEQCLPSDIKTVALKHITESELNELGSKRKFKREGDETSNTINMVRNKKTGVVVVTPSVKSYRAKLGDKDIGNYEVVESKMKE